MTVLARFSLLKRLLGNLTGIFAAYLAKGKPRHSDPVVVFDLQNIFIERVYAHLIYSFHASGYLVVIKSNLSLLANMSGYGKFVAQLPSVLLQRSLAAIDAGSIYIFDHDAPDQRFVNRVRISEDVLSPQAISTPASFLPFSMIPRLYFQNLYKESVLLRGSQRKIKIFFSGNSNPLQYDHKLYRTFFRKMSRVRMINALKDQMDANEATFVADIKGLPEENYINKVVIFEWSRISEQQKRIKGRIENFDWLQRLSVCDFFLACPGFIQPLCHNLIEAMSVGTIPILEHAEYMNPPLRDGIDCLTFSGEDELMQCVRKVLEMKEKEIRVLRENVIEYYDRYLTPEIVARFVADASKKNKTLFVHTSNYYQKFARTVG